MFAGRLSTLNPAVFSAATRGTLTGQTRVTGWRAASWRCRSPSTSRRTIRRGSAAPRRRHHQGAEERPDYFGPAPAVCGNGLVEGAERATTATRRQATVARRPASSCRPARPAHRTATRAPRISVTARGLRIAADDPLPAGCGCCRFDSGSPLASCIGDCDRTGSYRVPRSSRAVGRTEGERGLQRLPLGL